MYILIKLAHVYKSIFIQCIQQEIGVMISLKTYSLIILI